ncbi:MAG: carboxylating nicotinate-nucleotide diphosphorylase [Pseudomonadota bacterium]
MSVSKPKKSRFKAKISDKKLEADRIALVERAILEDVGNGDVTADLVSAAAMAQATVVVREPIVLCGIDWFDEVFRQIDDDIQITWHVEEGARVAADQTVCTLDGTARSLLTGERTALNFLQTLTGTATTTASYVDIVADTGCRLLDTRKTIPGLRLAQKYAARIGGAVNHRIGLFDAILIKENHIASAGSLAAAVRAARAANPALPVEIEVENLVQAESAMDTGVERILLDNFSLEDLRAAVALNQETGGHCELEASGGIEGDGLLAVAETGVDFISIGALTKHVRAADFSMRFKF